MNKEDKEAIKNFEDHARPIDKASFIMLKEILAVLKDIRKEVK